MAPSAGIGISWFGLILIVFVLVMIVKGLANPHSRPFLLGLLGVGVAAFVFLGLFRVARVSTADFDQTRVAEENKGASVIYSPGPPPGYSSSTIPVPPPPSYSPRPSAETLKPRKPKTSAAWAKLAKADYSATAVKSHTAGESPKPSTPPRDDTEDDAPQPPQQPPPAWVNAESKTQGGVYLMTRQTDPYTTELECEREVPKAVQSAVSEYAQLVLGSDQAKYVRFSESDLLGLVREKWDEPRRIDIGGESKAMHSLHVLIAFDEAMKPQLRTMADNAIVTQRLQGAGVVLGGVLGLLALVWGGLSFMGGRQDANLVHEAAAVAVKTRAWPVFTTLSVVCLLAVIIVLGTLFLYLG
jgi:hypothetical protein